MEGNEERVDWTTLLATIVAGVGAAVAFTGLLVAVSQSVLETLSRL